MWENLKRIFRLSNPVVSFVLAFICQTVILYGMGNLLMPVKTSEPVKITVKLVKAQEIKKPSTEKLEAKELDKLPVKKVAEPIVEKTMPEIEVKPPEPEPELKPEKKPEPQPKPLPEPKPAPKPRKKPKPKAQPKTKIKRPALAKPKPEIKPDPVTLFPDKNLEKEVSENSDQKPEPVKAKTSASLPSQTDVSRSKQSVQALSPDKRHAYLQKLFALLARNRRYPRNARRRNITGRVIVAFQVDRNGQALNIDIRSDTHKILADAAFDLVKKTRFPAPPEGWKKEFIIEVPISYHLR
jgi:protein TonB